MKSSKSKKHVETITVDEGADGVMCDGGMGALGHPAVYYDLEELSESHRVFCGYCNREFVKHK